MNSKIVLEIAALAAVTAGTIYIGKTIINKAKEEKKSSFRGDMNIVRYSRPKQVVGRYGLPVRVATQSAGCFCASNDPNKGGYFGDCPCEKGYYDVEKEMGYKNFAGDKDCDGCENMSEVRGSGVVQYYEKPVWTV